MRDFIFEVADSGGGATVGGHVGVADEAETQFEIERLVENLVLEDSGADHLAIHRDQHLVFARGKNFNLGNFRLLVKLLSAKLHRLARAMLPGFLQRGLQEHLLQQFRVIEILWVALEKGDSRKLGLLGVQILCFRKLKQRTDVVGLRRVNDDDALALLELIDDVVTVERCRHGHDDGHEEPEPRQAVALRKELRRVEFLAGEARGSRAVAGGSFTRADFGGLHRFSSNGLWSWQ